MINKGRIHFMEINRSRANVFSCFCAITWLFCLVIFHIAKARLIETDTTVAVPIWFVTLVVSVFSLVFIPLFHRIKHYATLAKMKVLKFVVRYLLVISYIALAIAIITIILSIFKI